ncbi:MAG TPA: GDSL-type esterase/lipase family protein, partial [Planctomycetota bacterium]|nr:GDSL-type esterase/lipase family protein [Planctomycetota bacterium]
ALAVASALLALLAVEVALRVIARGMPPGSLGAAIAKAGPLGEGEAPKWVHALRVDPHPRIVYGLRPGFDGPVLMGGGAVPLCTNSLGFRGPEWTRAKPPGTVRIVGLGDSVMMGYGVPIEESYLALLERQLAAARPGVRFECLDLGVAGYNTVQEVEVLRQVGLGLDPDLVLLGVVPNDANGIIYPRDPPSRLALDRSFLLRALSGQGGEHTWEDFAGHGPFRAAARELAALAERHGFELVAFTHRTTPTSGALLAELARSGVPTRDLGVELAAHCAAHGIDDYFNSALVVSSIDAHPSAAGHALIARDLAAFLVEAGLVDRAIAGAGAAPLRD